MWLFRKRANQNKKPNRDVVRGPAVTKAMRFQDLDGKPIKLGTQRREIDMDVFRKVKRALALKKAKKFYRTEAEIAKKFNLGTTTINLIKRAPSLKQYRELRRKVSKPDEY